MMRREIIECDECGKEIDYLPGVPVAPVSLHVFVSGHRVDRIEAATGPGVPGVQPVLDFCVDCSERLTTLPKLAGLIAKARAESLPWTKKKGAAGA